MPFFKYFLYLKHNLKITLSLFLSLLLSCGALGPEGKEKSLKLMDKVDNLLDAADEVVKTYKREPAPSQEVIEKHLEAKAAEVSAEEARKAAEEAKKVAESAEKEAARKKQEAEEAQEARRQAQIALYQKQDEERRRKNEQREKDRKSKEEEQRQAEEKNKNRYKEKIQESVTKLKSIITSIEKFEAIGAQQGSKTEVEGKEIENEVTGPIYDHFTGTFGANPGIFGTWAESLDYDNGDDIWDKIEKARKALRKKIKEDQGGNEQTKSIVDVTDIKTELSGLRSELNKFIIYLMDDKNDSNLKEKINQCIYSTCGGDI